MTSFSFMQSCVVFFLFSESRGIKEIPLLFITMLYIHRFSLLLSLMGGSDRE
jgi:hypothetical protein